MKKMALEMIVTGLIIPTGAGIAFTVVIIYYVLSGGNALSLIVLPFNVLLSMTGILAALNRLPPSF